jgi:hypothetical protein
METHSPKDANNSRQNGPSTTWIGDLALSGKWCGARKSWRHMSGWMQKSYCDENESIGEEITKNNYVKVVERKRDKNNDLRCLKTK